MDNLENIRAEQQRLQRDIQEWKNNLEILNRLEQEELALPHEQAGMFQENLEDGEILEPGEVSDDGNDELGNCECGNINFDRP